jgi:hypothetical protein
VHGLINRSIQHFLRDTYGLALWEAVVVAADLPAQGFEALQSYDDRMTEAMVLAASARLAKPRDALLEDYGIYLAGREGLRRLLRFGGADFVDFLYSLEELPGRVRLAVPDLLIADMVLRQTAPGQFRLEILGGPTGFVHVMCGVLQAMADDFGALAVIGVTEAEGGAAAVQIDLIEASYAAGRAFQLTPNEAS